MNLLFLIAAALLVLLAVAHSVLGERLIFRELFPMRELPPLLGSQVFMRQTLRFTWHTTSVLVLVLAWILVTLARAPVSDRLADIALSVAAGLLVAGLISGIVARGRHFSWIVFLAAAGLVWLGLGAG